jgi:uncharacterized protein YjeT (DUF2065 family)
VEYIRAIASQTSTHVIVYNDRLYFILLPWHKNRIYLPKQNNNYRGVFMNAYSFNEIVNRLLHPVEQSRTAKTLELFGWLILVEGTFTLFAPHMAAAVLHVPPLNEQSANYVRLIGMLVSGLGVLYVVSGRLNAREFVIASLIDRPMVPVVMAVLWYLTIVPASVALLFSFQDFGSFLWTLSTWRADQRDAITTAEHSSS